MDSRNEINNVLLDLMSNQMKHMHFLSHCFVTIHSRTDDLLSILYIDWSTAYSDQHTRCKGYNFIESLNVAVKHH